MGNKGPGFKNWILITKEDTKGGKIKIQGKINNLFNKFKSPPQIYNDEDYDMNTHTQCSSANWAERLGWLRAERDFCCRYDAPDLDCSKNCDFILGLAWSMDWLED